MNLPMNNESMNASMKMKLLILLCLAALPPMSVRAADNAEPPAAKPGGVEAIASGRCEQRLAETDLNLAFRQYERVQMEAFEAKLKLRSLDTVPDLADAERAKQAQLLERKISNLGELADELRKRIMSLGNVPQKAGTASSKPELEILHCEPMKIAQWKKKASGLPVGTPRVQVEQVLPPTGTVLDYRSGPGAGPVAYWVDGNTLVKCRYDDALNLAVPIVIEEKIRPEQSQPQPTDQ